MLLVCLQYYLYELVIKQLVSHNRFYQLHQYLQYHVLSDSKPLVRESSLMSVMFSSHTEVYLNVWSLHVAISVRVSDHLKLYFPTPFNNFVSFIIFHGV